MFGPQPDPPAVEQSRLRSSLRSHSPENLPKDRGVLLLTSYRVALIGVALRAAVRTAVGLGIRPLGFHNGFAARPVDTEVDYMRRGRPPATPLLVDLMVTIVLGV